MAIIYLGIGSNLGDRMAHIGKALTMLKEAENMRLLALSSLYETKPMGFTDQPDFINCVAKIFAGMNPESLLETVKAIENQLGREPDTHLLPRPIDLDILLYDDKIINSERLSVPHPRMKERRFVLDPLLEIAPELTDPVSDLPFRSYLGKVSNQEVIKISDSEEVKDVRRRIA